MQIQPPNCQSCGKYMSGEDFGTDVSGTKSKEYCSRCYKNGQFTQPDLTLENVVEEWVKFITQHDIVNDRRMSEEESRNSSREWLSKLKRWTVA